MCVFAHADMQWQRRPYCRRTCVVSFRGKSGRGRKRMRWIGLWDQSTMRTLGNKVRMLHHYWTMDLRRLPNSILNSEQNVLRLWSNLLISLPPPFSVHLRGPWVGCGLLCFLSGPGAAQETERHSGHAQRPGEELYFLGPWQAHIFVPSTHFCTQFMYVDTVSPFQYLSFSLLAVSPPSFPVRRQTSAVRERCWRRRERLCLRLDWLKWGRERWKIPRWMAQRRIRKSHWKTVS